MSKKEDKEQQALRDKIADEIRRIRVPRNNQEVIGVLAQRLGGSRCSVRGLDGKTRICRIPGKLKRSLWVREGDVIMIKKWELDQDTKGDIIFKYTKSQIQVLRRKGLLDNLDEFRNF
ncbi:translation initiation factor eIF-1A [archaeon]|jgi:translation initiation factor 1A|nr:translation initiation factor eIF-1A [Cryomorphaceae bacterium]MBT4648666.1 translation initiation factor eIF-1A [archaeon]MBT6821790.1 translation initiation factor eIF-1A [archaeon]MBT7391185.1 translation initiation factor eIF-1A [archaeon]